jgi:hypothetical protein
MDALFIASYVARQNGIASAEANSDRFYEQAGRGGWTLAPLASALGIVGAWAGLLSLIPTA